MLRRACQVIFLAAFVLLLRAAQSPTATSVDVSVFLRADPLAALLTLLALPHFAAAGNMLYLFFPALILLVLTALLGRFFCGWICPLGTCIDVFHLALVRPFRKSDSRRAHWPHLKYYLLAALLVAALFGVQAACFLDPIPLTTRAFATAFHPALLSLQNWLVAHETGPLAALSSRLNLQWVPSRSFTFAWPLTAPFILALALGFVSRRYWCRNVCPLGALLAFVGRFGLWRRHVSASCKQCNNCISDCKMRAIPAGAPHCTRTPECILCYDCLSCPQPGITRIGLTTASQRLATGIDVTRRRLLAAAGAGLLYGLIARVPFAGRSVTPARNPLLIRPPGAIVRDSAGKVARMMTEDEFRTQCLRCGECMKACPTNVIQPALRQSGIDGFYTPVITATAGWCEQSCNACGLVCPSGALRPFTIEEKSDIRIAEARIDTATCLSWQTGDDYTLCLICEGVCPYNAITAEDTDGSGQLRPVVHPDICVGCGLCEYNCPVGPPAAIRIYRRGGQHAA